MELQTQCDEEYAEIGEGDDAPVSERTASAALELVIGSLSTLNSRFGSEFLALATVLQSNSQRARRIAVHAHKATGAESFAQSSHSIEVLQRIVQDAASVSEMVEISTDRMAEILSRVKLLLPHLRRLGTLHMRLRIVSVLARIEGGRLTSSEVDISALGADIDRLAEDVHRSVDGLFEESSALSVALTGGVAQLNLSAAEEKERSAELARSTEAVLVPARMRLEASTASAQLIDEQFRGFHHSVDRIVMSLQAEDSARQRVEHVQQALHRAGEALERAEDADQLAGIFWLQHVQLNGTRQLLLESMDGIHLGLEELRPVVVELVRQTELQSSKAVTEAEQLADLIDQQVGFVSATFQSCSASVRGIVVIVNGVIPLIERMARGIDALRSVAWAIQLISLNATVKTAQIGEGGAGMGVLAAELHTIIVESHDDIQHVSQGLGAVSGALADITAVRTKSEGSMLLSSGSAEQVGNVLGELATVIRSSSPAMQSGMVEVERMAALLDDDVMQGCSLSSRGDVLGGMFDRELEALDEAFDLVHYDPIQGMELGTTALSREMMGFYTMESERELHCVFFPADRFEEAVAAGDDSDVELF
jgi:hypothetical protein